VRYGEIPNDIRELEVVENAWQRISDFGKNKLSKSGIIQP
jgi:hypothetical protein